MSEIFFIVFLYRIFNHIYVIHLYNFFLLMWLILYRRVTNIHVSNKVIFVTQDWLLRRLRLQYSDRGQRVMRIWWCPLRVVSQTSAWWRHSPALEQSYPPVRSTVYMVHRKILLFYFCRNIYLSMPKIVFLWCSSGVNHQHFFFHFPSQQSLRINPYSAGSTWVIRIWRL